jgi:hemin uptake protein HemP
MPSFNPTPSEALSAATSEFGVRVAPAGSPRLDAGMPARRRLSSQALLGNEREIEIEHSGQLYRLRLTSLGKLILTK